MIQFDFDTAFQALTRSKNGAAYAGVSAEAPVERHDFVAASQSECRQIRIVPNVRRELRELGQRSPLAFQVQRFLGKADSRIEHRLIVDCPSLN